MEQHNGNLSRPIPERVKEAREARGYSLESFAEAIGVSRQAVAQYEIGQISPSSNVMSKIIAVTAQPPAFFITPPRRASDYISPFWRSLKRMEDHHRRRMSRRLQWVSDIIEYISRFIHLPDVNLPSVDFDPVSGADEEIEDAAMRVRDLWSLGRGPVHGLAAVFEDNGIVLVHEPVGCNDMDAVSCWQGGRPYIIFSSAVISGPRSKFNLAHELGHLVLHAGVNVNTRNLDKIERQANHFAGAFLLPRDTFAKEILGTSLRYFKFLKERWGVSISAMIYRCKEIGVLSKSQHAYLMRQMNAWGIKAMEPMDELFPVDHPSVLAESFKMLINNAVQTKAQIEDSLPINLADVESLCGVPKGYLDTRIVHLSHRPRFIQT